jgi:hypothetical protein
MNQSIITADLLDVAESRWRHVRTTTHEQLVLSVVDCADGANLMVVQVRRGSRVFTPNEFTEELDGPRARSIVLDVVHQHRVDDEPVHILMSRTGLGNAPFDFMKQVAKQENVFLYGVIWYGSPRKSDGDVSWRDPFNRYQNLRAELMFEVKTRLCADLTMQPHEQRRRELLTPMGFVDTSGKHIVETSDDIRQRTGTTLPFFDALAMSLAINPMDSRRPRSIGHAKHNYTTSAVAA